MGNAIIMGSLMAAVLVVVHIPSAIEKLDCKKDVRLMYRRLNRASLVFTSEKDMIDSFFE